MTSRFYSPKFTNAPAIMFGDSILRRVLETYCGIEAWYSENGSKRIGYSVGCHTIHRLRRSLQTMDCWFKYRTAVVMIGTFDVLRGSTATRFNLMCLQRVLRTKNFVRIFVCTIPPIPRATEEENEKLLAYNEMIRECMGDSVIDVYRVFTSHPNLEEFFSQDRLHPNPRGLKLILKAIERHGVVVQRKFVGLR